MLSLHIYLSTFAKDNTVKSVLRGHLWDKNKEVDLSKEVQFI